MNSAVTLIISKHTTLKLAETLHKAQRGWGVGTPIGFQAAYVARPVNSQHALISVDRLVVRRAAADCSHEDYASTAARRCPQALLLWTRGT